MFIFLCTVLTSQNLVSNLKINLKYTTVWSFNICILLSNPLGKQLDPVLSLLLCILSQWYLSFLACLPMASWFCYCFPCPDLSWCACSGKKTSQCRGRTIRTCNKGKNLHTIYCVSHSKAATDWRFVHNPRLHLIVILIISRQNWHSRLRPRQQTLPN